MIGIGIIFGVLVLDYRIKNNRIKYNIEIDLYIGITISIIFGFFGAKIFDLFYKDQRVSINSILNSGMTYYGGFILGIIIFSIYNLIRKRNLLYMTNIVIPSIIMAHAFGRIGCFLGGCCFGKPADNFIGVIFPYNSIPFNYYEQNIKIYPTQLFESAFLFILSMVMIKIIPLKLNLPIYFVFYGLFRFFIEYLRGDYRGVLFTNIFSPSQIISVLFIILGILLVTIQPGLSDFQHKRRGFAVKEHF
jgi:phosphatidylglycerol:prolipoprotein diacylglycerol transferase